MYRRKEIFIRHSNLNMKLMKNFICENLKFKEFFKELRKLKFCYGNYSKVCA